MKIPFLPNFRKHYEEPNYLFYFISLIALVIIPSLSSIWSGGYIVLQIFYTLVIVMSILFASKSKTDVFVMTLMGTFLIVTTLIYGPRAELYWFNPAITALFFGIVLFRIVQHVLEDRSLEVNDILALASGYLVLPISATPYFFMLSRSLPHAFSGAEQFSFIDMMYYCFITSTTVGYGDILPVHSLARSSALILAVFGQLYLSILAGLIIGKFVSSGKTKILK